MVLRVLLFVGAVVITATLWNVLAYSLIRRRRRLTPRIIAENIWPEAEAFSHADVGGTVDTEDLDYVRGWLEGICARLKEVGIQFVSFGFLTAEGSTEVHWYVHAADPISTHAELASMVNNALLEAGARPPE